MKNLYVGNMEASTSVEQLKAAFATYGPVEVVNIVMDKVTGAGRGFGFVEMTEDKDAQEAILGLNGSLLMGKAIVVNEAHPKSKSTTVPTTH
jgi:RNA recognition motif-containing protein